MPKIKPAPSPALKRTHRGRIMATTTPAITLPCPPKFAAFCASKRLTPEQVLGTFISDLTEPSEPLRRVRRSESECQLAAAWFGRVTEAAV